MNRQILFVVAGCALLFVAVAGFLSFGKSTVQAQETAGRTVDTAVKAEALLLDQMPETPARYAAGWALSSENDDFGGFSGLVVSTDAKTLVAINDKGDWWQAGFDLHAVAAPTQGTMRGFVPGAVADKSDLDAESLIRFREGFLVSFEQNHRLEFVAEPGEKPVPANMAAIDFGGISSNGGMEAIALLPSGTLLAFAERGLDVGGRLKAWLVNEDATASVYFEPPANFAPTDAATLPNGDILVLLRKYSAIEGVAIKVVHLKAGDVRPGAVMEGAEILHLTPEGPVDNMEGLDIAILDDDTVRLVMISDDNFNPLQRTLLMMFDYDYR